MTNLWFVNESARPLVYALCRLRRPSVPALRTACARASSRFAASNGQRSGRECIFTFRTDPQFSMVVPLRSQARLWLSLLHWAYYGLFPPLAAAFVRPCASLARCSGAADALWACPRAFSPSGLHLFASVCSAKNARNDVHAVISDESLVLPRLCQYSVSAKLTVGLPFPQESHEAPSLSRFPLNLAKIGSFYIYFDLAAVLPSFSARRAGACGCARQAEAAGRGFFLPAYRPRPRARFSHPCGWRWRAGRRDRRPGFIPARPSSKGRPAEIPA